MQPHQPNQKNNINKRNWGRFNVTQSVTLKLALRFITRLLHLPKHHSVQVMLIHMPFSYKISSKTSAINTSAKTSTK